MSVIADNQDAVKPPRTVRRHRVVPQLRAIAAQAPARVLDFLLPPQCLSCGQRVSAHPGLCAVCWPVIEFIEKPYCPRTGLPFAFDPGEGVVSAAALAKPPLWQRARAAACFGPVTRSLIHALKYRDRLEAATLMARLMASAGGDLLLDADIIVPVPLYRARLWKRRYNQAALLADALPCNAAVPVVTDLLKRRRATRSQVGLNFQDRRRNVRGAFELRPDVAHRLAGRRVLLVDDVITTGATAGACTRALLDGGAAEVDVLAFALVSNPLRVDI